VEDSPADLRILQEALKEIGVSFQLLVARDGDEAMALLCRRGGDGQVPMPDLILLDLNLPGKDGREFLAEIKAIPRVSSIPLVVFTASASDYDLRICHDRGAGYYLVKPVGLDQYLMAAKAIKTFWLERGAVAAGAN